MLLFLIEKEIKQILRDPIIPRMLIMLPLMTTFVYPWTTNQEIRNVRVNVVDNDHSSLTHKIINEISASDYFNLTGTSSTYPEALEQVESDKTDMILELPTDFEISEKEENLIQLVANFAQVVKEAGDTYSPACIANYTYDLVKEYNQFYHDYTILREADEKLKVFRLVLSADTELCGDDRVYAHARSHRNGYHKELNGVYDGQCGKSRFGASANKKAVNNII